jgi:prevent-host-death family protein
MSTVTIEDAKARLSELIEQLHPGEEVIITRDQKPVARLVAEAKLARAKDSIMDKLQAIQIQAPRVSPPISTSTRTGRNTLKAIFVDTLFVISQVMTRSPDRVILPDRRSP